MTKDGKVHLLPIALPIRTTSEASAANAENNAVGVLRIVLVLPELTRIVESSPTNRRKHTLS